MVTPVKMESTSPFKWHVGGLRSRGPWLSSPPQPTLERMNADTAGEGLRIFSRRSKRARFAFHRSSMTPDIPIDCSGIITCPTRNMLIATATNEQIVDAASDSFGLCFGVVDVMLKITSRISRVWHIKLGGSYLLGQPSNVLNLAKRESIRP